VDANKRNPTKHPIEKQITTRNETESQIQLTGGLGGLGCVDPPPDPHHLHHRPPARGCHLSHPRPRSHHYHTHCLETPPTANSTNIKRRFGPKKCCIGGKGPATGALSRPQNAFGIKMAYFGANLRCFQFVVYTYKQQIKETTF